jgi:hypothetical protein
MKEEKKSKLQTNGAFSLTANPGKGQTPERERKIQKMKRQVLQDCLVNERSLSGTMRTNSDEEHQRALKVCGLLRVQLERRSVVNQ